MFVGHLPDEFLDQVFERGDAGCAAVLVHDNCHLVTTATQFAEQPVELHRFRHAHRLELQGRHRDIRPPPARHRNRLLHVHDTDHVIRTLVEHRKAGVTGLLGKIDDVLGRSRALNARDAGAGGHDVGCSVAGKKEGAVEEGRRIFLEQAGTGRAAHERGQFLGGARPGEFLLRLDSGQAEHPIRALVEQENRGFEHGREHRLEGYDQLRRVDREGQGKVLGDELAENHRHKRGDDDRYGRRDDRHRREGQAYARQWPRQERTQCRLHGVTGEQRCQGDAELGAGKMSRGDPERGNGHPQAGLPAALAHLKLGAVEVDQCELAGDEQASANCQNDANAEHDPLKHGCHRRISRGRVRLREMVYGWANSQVGGRPLFIQLYRTRLPGNWKRLAFLVAGGRLDSDEGTFVEFLHRCRPRVGERAAHAGGDHVEQILHGGAQRIQVDLRT